MGLHLIYGHSHDRICRLVDGDQELLLPAVNRELYRLAGIGVRHAVLLLAVVADPVGLGDKSIPDPVRERLIIQGERIVLGLLLLHCDDLHLPLRRVLHGVCAQRYHSGELVVPGRDEVGRLTISQLRCD